jgi:SAM-dependent methyltransferase
MTPFRQWLRRTNEVSRLFGIDLKAFVRSVKGIPFFVRDYARLKKQQGRDGSFPFHLMYPIMGERFMQAGEMSGAYFHQDLHVAKRIYQNKPATHLDIGSSQARFVACVSVFRQIDVMDIREQLSTIDQVSFRRADLMELPEDLIESYDSVSSLHALEHFGLGRYNDPIDYNGHLKGIANITRILKPCGTFYFSAPIGDQRIEFNAHRVFSMRYLLDVFHIDFKVLHFSYVNDAGDFFEHVELSEENVDKNFGCFYGCGIFELIKNKDQKLLL